MTAGMHRFEGYGVPKSPQPEPVTAASDVDDDDDFIDPRKIQG